MSIYDYREEPAYRDDHKPYTNKRISAWWGNEQDKMIEEAILNWQWHWYWEISEMISSKVDKNDSPLFMSATNAYNNLMYFAQTRAIETGLVKLIRKPKWKECPLCENKFIESSLPHPFVKRLGIDNLDFCSPCLRDTVVQGSGNQQASKEDCLNYIQKLTNFLQRIPPQGYGEDVKDFYELSYEERLGCLKIMKNKPTTKKVKEIFGAWLKALIEANVLDDNTRKTSRGIHCVAKDGHICLSLGEKTIDDYLFLNNIEHSREPSYPEGNYRADFKINNSFVEYFGLAGNPDYDKKIKLKKKLCKKYQIHLISIFPKDLMSISKLEKKLFAV